MRPGHVSSIERSAETLSPHNNEMQQTSHGSNGGSLLISVLGRPVTGEG
jgi:hypothetical protein